ncbi:unnamed protein product [Clavelina lepadiformis]|uniref:C-type lectin domain-containing protein n=1 Tax=Clavelina lepadiformis TaxID=159417 RepID=A0ABP0FTJ9_CLALP
MGRRIRKKKFVISRGQVYTRVVQQRSIEETSCSHQRSAFVDGKEYRFFRSKVTFTQAALKCKTWGDRLGSVRNEVTQKCLREMITTDGFYAADYWETWVSSTPFLHRGVWLGGTDVGEEGKWKWENDSDD